MRKTWAALALAALVVIPLAAQTRDQAKAFVKQAVGFAKKNPREKFLEEVTGVKGQFHFNKGQKLFPPAPAPAPSARRRR